MWVNLFAGSNTVIPIGKNKVDVTMETGYPWKGNVQITVSPSKKSVFELRLRIPGWLTTPAPATCIIMLISKTGNRL
ncbi:MAG: glycoside hydrolase family 127 protein [Chitinophagaceae bacterium]|nr:glycoside hydrolase family 127 protein [Chitinophagaceae bacterium]